MHVKNPHLVKMAKNQKCPLNRVFLLFREINSSVLSIRLLRSGGFKY